MKKKLISCDIDGILNDYPACWLDYLARRCGERYASIKQAKDLQPLYKEYKSDYRRSEFKANLPVNPVGVGMLRSLAGKGYGIIMASSRPFDNPLYPDLYRLTWDWLAQNGIPFDELVFKNSTADFTASYPDIAFHIEDERKYAQAIAEKGIKVFLYSAHLKPGENHSDENIIIVDDLSDIPDIIHG